MKKVKNAILDWIQYFLILTWWLGFMLICLWCVSCTTNQKNIEVFLHQEDFEFNFEYLLSYDSTSQTGLYIVGDTVISNGCGCIVYDTIKIEFNGVDIRDLEQGEPAWISENKYLLYD